MAIPRFTFEMYGDDPRCDPDPDGEWMPSTLVEKVLDEICEATPDPAVHEIVRRALSKEGQ